MSTSRSFKEARRHARAISADIDREQRAARSVPKWRTVALALGFSGFSRRWIARWEERHAKALKSTTKKTAHYIVAESRRSDIAPQKPYGQVLADRKMRSGPQPLPKGMDGNAGYVGQS